MRISIEILVQNQYRGGFKNIYIRSIHDDERLSIIFHRVSFHSTRILQLSHRVRDTRKLGSQVNVRNSVRILEGAGWTFSILKNFPLSLSLSQTLSNTRKCISRERSFHSSFRIHLASFAFELNSTWRKIHLRGFIVRKNIKGNQKQGNLIFPISR